MLGVGAPSPCMLIFFSVSLEISTERKQKKMWSILSVFPIFWGNKKTTCIKKVMLEISQYFQVPRICGRDNRVFYLFWSCSGWRIFFIYFEALQNKKAKQNKKVCNCGVLSGCGLTLFSNQKSALLHSVVFISYLLNTPIGLLFVCTESSKRNSSDLIESLWSVTLKTKFTWSSVFRRSTLPLSNLFGDGVLQRE